MREPQRRLFPVTLVHELVRRLTSYLLLSWFIACAKIEWICSGLAYADRSEVTPGDHNNAIEFTSICVDVYVHVDKTARL